MILFFIVENRDMYQSVGGLFLFSAFPVGSSVFLVLTRPSTGLALPAVTGGPSPWYHAKKNGEN